MRWAKPRYVLSLTLLSLLSLQGCSLTKGNVVESISDISNIVGAITAATVDVTKAVDESLDTHLEGTMGETLTNIAETNTRVAEEIRAIREARLERGEDPDAWTLSDWLTLLAGGLGVTGLGGAAVASSKRHQRAERDLAEVRGRMQPMAQGQTSAVPPLDTQM